MTGLALFCLALCLAEGQEHFGNELFSLMGTPPQKSFPGGGVGELPEPPFNKTKAAGKDANDLLDRASKPGSKFPPPLQPGGWQKHGDLPPPPRPAGKAKRRPPPDHGAERSRTPAPDVLPRTAPAGAANRTQKSSPPGDPLTAAAPPEPEARPGSPAAKARRDPPPAGRRMDPEENRPGKPKSEHTQEAICLSECRKEKEERDYFCHSEFAINGIVHDIEAISKGMKILTLLVNSDGFYKMSQLTITPDGFFFKVRVLVVDTYKCAKPCPDLKLGSRYIVMGQIYPRRRNRPSELQALQVGRLRAGDGLVRSHSYVKRFNKRRDQKVQEAKRTKCR
ncbi:UPF0450 protein C17orf58 homolog isoform X3 [Lepisosteus oculatus]|uniref:UPF0450 protein C17orf58 homolog isoform X3 n=1 Tax=Lepisosteus oculatus TaxID=7918 RepID=UPI00371C4734